VSYEEEDTCVSYEEEDTCVSYEDIWDTSPLGHRSELVTRHFSSQQCEP
jgi:hypothetical protein